MIKVTMKHAAIGNVQMEFDSFMEMWEAVSVFEMPEVCDKCGSQAIKPMFKKVKTKRQDAKVPMGTVIKTYGLRCSNGHEYYLGIHNDKEQELFVYSGRKFQDPYTNDQLATAEYREACPHCKTTNQFHAKDCPNFNEKPQEARTEPEPAKSADNTSNPVSTPTEAPEATTGQAARQSTADRVAQATQTPVQTARNKFVRSISDLGLSMGNTELAIMLKSMLGVESVPSPLTPEHWITCYNLCNEYKTAAEIGGIALDANALAVMLCTDGETPGTRSIEQYNAAEWKAAAERAMEG